MGEVSKKQLLEMMQMMQTMIENISDDDEEAVEEKPVRKTAKKKTVRKKNKPKVIERGVVQSNRPNLFDEMPEKDMHKSDTIIDKKLNVHPPSVRSRKFSMVTVQCRVCGKQEEISPSLIPEDKSRYKCNNCCSSQG